MHEYSIKITLNYSYRKVNQEVKNQSKAKNQSETNLNNYLIINNDNDNHIEK